MSDKEMFNMLLSRNPNPGKKNDLVRKDEVYKIPGWVFESSEEVLEIKSRLLTNFIGKHNLTSQIFWDVYVLGLTDIEQRPKCPICGADLIFRGIPKGGYGKICGSITCKSEYARREMNDLWKNKDYKEMQSSSHKEWSSKEENIERLRQGALKAWQNKDYREHQIRVHIEWAEKEDNKQAMRERSLEMWQRPGYREMQSDIHREYAKNNPNKIKCGTGGIVKSSKSSFGKLSYDSSWEMNFIKLLEDIDEVVSVERAGFYIPYYIDGKEFNYFPDFCLSTNLEKRYLVEIKANWMISSDPKTRCKIEAGREYVKNHPEEFAGYVLLKDENLCDSPHYIKFNFELAKEELLKFIN